MYETLINLIYYGTGSFVFLTVLAIVASNEVVRYYVKFIFFMLSAAALTIVCTPYMLLRVRDWRNALLPAKGITTVAKLLGVTFCIKGRENIVKNSGCVVIINHQSILDLCVLGELWPVLEKCTVIAKKEVLYFGTFGLSAWLWGTIFIDRRKSGEAREAVNATTKAIKNDQSKLLLFAEGHRHSGKMLQPFKKGAFHLAIAAQAPIQPVVTSRYYFLSDKPKSFDSGTSYITILPPIPTEGLTKDDLPMLMEKAYEVMNRTFLETSAETLNAHLERLKSE